MSQPHILNPRLVESTTVLTVWKVWKSSLTHNGSKILLDAKLLTSQHIISDIPIYQSQRPLFSSGGLFKYTELMKMMHFCLCRTLRERTSKSVLLDCCIGTFIQIMSCSCTSESGCMMSSWQMYLIFHCGTSKYDKSLYTILDVISHPSGQEKNNPPAPPLAGESVLYLTLPPAG